MFTSSSQNVPQDAPNSTTLLSHMFWPKLFSLHLCKKQVGKVLCSPPRSPMCSLLSFPITPHFYPIYFAQSSPPHLQRWAKSGAHSIFTQTTLFGGAFKVLIFNFLLGGFFFFGGIIIDQSK
jgi:hypothetical protein